MTASMAELEGDVEYLLFVENEALFPMTDYLKLKPVVQGLVGLIMLHSDATMRDTKREVSRQIAILLRDNVADMILGAERAERD